ncbi:MAG: DNA polymerase III, epsilon subunit [Moorella sp. 60_41]|nr:MAG: DNA polymerase III, epsilon subunit [Moorella sp. 60_41]
MIAPSYVVLDLETTGLDTGRDRILEIAALRFEGGVLVEEFSTLVNPGIPVPPPIQRLTGIDDNMVSAAPSLDEVLPGLLSLLEGTVLFAHNSSFDLAFLERAVGAPCPGPVLDTLELSRILFPSLASHKLGFLAAHFGLAADPCHRALADARAAAALLEILWEETLRLPALLLQRLQVLAPSPLDLWFEAAAKESRHRAPAGETAATTQGLFAPNGETMASVPFSPDLLAGHLAPGGSLSAGLPGYEYRPEQEKVLRTVASALAEGRHALVEAGTGTGKSLAYLIPAVYWARHNQCRVAVATHTISLQEQLWNKDIPFLQEVLPVPFRAALLKGRSNYLCRRRLRQLEENLAAGGPAERLFLMRLLRWLHLTTTGDWGEMKITPEEEAWRNMLSSDNETCLGPSCPFASGACFVTAARRRAEEADILILNHSLLLSDLCMDNQVLPAFAHVIIDEAHHLEETATDHLAVTCSQAGLASLFRRLEGSGSLAGFLHQLAMLAAKLPPEKREPLGRRVEGALSAAAAAREAAGALFEALRSWWEGLRVQEPQLRLTARVKEHPLWENVLVAADGVEEAWTHLERSLEKLISLLDDMGAAERAREAEKLAAALQKQWQALSHILDEEGQGSVAWIEKTPAGSLALYSAPVEVGPILQEILFKPLKSVILTSATLRVDGTFDFYCHRTGLDLLPPEKLCTAAFASPFNYRDQALICAATDLPNPGRQTDEEYAEATAQAIANVSLAAGGRTLVLCSSHRFLRAAYEAVGRALAGTPFVVLGQGLDGNRFQLLEEFTRCPQAVLLGANTFWEGIDLPGDLLRCVVIPRLPFPAPNVPILAARMEDLASKGKNPFASLSLPVAVIRFRQGFGRLIRRASDRGALVVLDPRLTKQSYGASFLRSLPPVAFRQGPMAVILRCLTAFFNF